MQRWVGVITFLGMNVLQDEATGCTWIRDSLRTSSLSIPKKFAMENAKSNTNII